MEKITLKTDRKDFEFVGELKAVASSYKPQCGKERWTELKVYVTDSGNYVCEKLGMSEIPGEKVFRSVYITHEPERIQGFFGPSLYARSIFDQLGIEYPKQRIE